MNLIFKTPPPPQAGRGVSKHITDETLATLRQRSGEWALFAEGVSKSKAASIRFAGKRHGLQVVTRGSGPMDVYVRWVD